MEHFLLIHGSWHGAWCWHKIAPRLIAAGHSVSVPDLLGRGANRRWSHLVSLNAMVRHIGGTLRPALTRLKLSADRYGAVPRAYIRLTEDRAVTPQLQDKCIEKVGVDRVEDIKASHSAYFSRPDVLTQTILSICRS
ncbi:hypothetical protein [Yoonia sp. R2-816]|uniref:hypothetical protein n=1 Tax=Yoonia sp. R2-816 TaxID=3342638 RepID=UPI00372AC939